ncbi:globin CTT-IIIA-like [Branchiostoma floridae x Branchiostoma belcheri]
MADVKDSWGKLTASGFEDAGEKIFLALLKDDGIKSNFPKFKDIPYGSLPGNAAMRAHGAKVCKVLDSFIKGDDGAATNVGKMHKGLGMSNDQIGAMRGALVTVLEQSGLGGAVGAWGKLFDRFMEVHKAAY